MDRIFQEENLPKLVRPNGFIMVDRDPEIFNIMLHFIESDGNLDFKGEGSIKSQLIFNELKHWEVAKYLKGKGIEQKFELEVMEMLLDPPSKESFKNLSENSQYL